MTLPTGIVGTDAYNVLYADALHWLKEGTVDYVTPQLYWPTGGGQDYGTLLPWWADRAHEKNKHVYSGQGAYRLPDDAGSLLLSTMSHQRSLLQDAWTFAQISLQIEINRENGAEGTTFFSQKDFIRVDGLEEHLILNDFQSAAFVPQTPCAKGSLASCMELCTSPSSAESCRHSCEELC